MPRQRTIALGGLGVFLALVALQHLLRPDLPPARHFVSEYARGWTHPLQTLAFLGWSAAMAATAALALRTPPPGARPRALARAVTVAGLAAAAAGALLAAAFATQTVAGELPPDVRRTTSGRLHDLGTLLVLAGLLVAALASLRLIGRARYRWTVAGLGVVVLAIVPVMVTAGIDAPGIGQRGFILVGCAWQWRCAVEAAAVTPPRRPRGRRGAGPAARSRAQRGAGPR